MKDPINPNESPLSRPEPPTLRDYTSARVALIRTGASLSTRDTLDFALAHAQARDAVHATLSLPTLLEALHARSLNPLTVKSAALDRTTYLRRPDLGRTLSHQSTTLFTTNHHPVTTKNIPENTLAIILADGLSALAIDRHAIPLLDALLPLLTQFTLTPVVIAEQARVALGDPIGHLLHANLTILLIGERPGLSSPDSLGAYLTWSPRPGRTDAQRNCISNIRTHGLDYATAASRIAFLATEAHRLQLSGTAIKEVSTNTIEAP